ncbi:MAG: response regulator, partial [Calditrichia bacterium]
MSKYRILAVDDDFASRLLVKKALEDKSHQIEICASGEEALERLKTEQYELMITDLIMEKTGGLELIEEIKQKKYDLKVILLTGHASIETAIQAVRLGALDYLLKPINIEELRLRVSQAFERIEMEKRLKEAERNLTYTATIATANHEINQPLTVIISAIDMIKMELEKVNIKNSRLINYLDLMNKSSVRIANLLRKLREIHAPTIQEIPLGMKMIEIEDDGGAVPTATDRYILVIEDEENLRQIIQRILESASY